MPGSEDDAGFPPSRTPAMLSLFVSWKEQIKIVAGWGTGFDDDMALNRPESGSYYGWKGGRRKHRRWKGGLQGRGGSRQGR